MEEYITLSALSGPAVKDAIVIRRRQADLTEHVLHARDVRNIPRTKVLIKGGGPAEHAVRGGHRAGIPGNDVRVIERGGSPERITQIGHGRGQGGRYIRQVNGIAERTRKAGKS